MAKRLILLMLFIPLIIMVSLYATTKTVSLAVDIGVTGVKVTSDKYLYFDIDNPHTEEITYTVYPTNAKNQEVTFTSEPYEDEPQCELDIEGGLITPKSTGVARVNVVTNDGGFKDSVIVYVSSNEVEDIKITNKEELAQLYVGDNKKINILFTPSEPNDKTLIYTSSDEDVVKVDSLGNIRAVGRGKAIITVSSEKYGVSDSLDITVLNKDVIDIDIKDNVIDTFNQSGQINISIDTIESYTKDNFVITFKENNKDVTSDFTYSLKENGNASGLVLDYTLNKPITTDTTYSLEIMFSLPSGLVRIVNVTLNFKADFDFSFLDDVIYLYEGQTEMTQIILDPSDIKLDYEIKSSGPICMATGNTLIIGADKIGIYEVEVTGSYEGLSKTHTLTVLVVPRNINILEASNYYGISNQLVFGEGQNHLSLATTEDVINTFKSNLVLVPYYNDKETKLVTCTYNESKEAYDINIDKSFKGDVTFKLVLQYEDIMIPYQAFKVKCLGSAKNVTNYEELRSAIDSKQIVVLQNDIKDFPSSPIENVDYTEIPTTYDWTYYKNQDKTQPSVKVFFNVKNDIYGNGYEINGHSSLYEGKIDENGLLLDNAIFRGPLDFVGIGNGSGSTASVKAQDNIFMGLYDNVNLYDVTIKNCNDVDDLTKLNYAGTTVEMLGDNITINYSRLSNGRTVLRAFGDISDSAKVCHIDIKNSVLSNGRDFIIRMGSNLFKDGTTKDGKLDLDSLYLDSNDKFPMPYNNTNNKAVQQYYESLNDEDRAKYDEKYIKTYVKLSNVALYQSGIFSIGLDSHFAGSALAGTSDYNSSQAGILTYWHDLAKTSYGAKLILDNTVNIYDWKPLNMVDSSTLIEVVGDAFSALKFDVAGMVKYIASQPGFTDILYNDETYQDYVHGGIAFFGGGYNYDVITYLDNYNSFKLYGYQIGLDDVASQSGNLFGQILPAAAGNTDFYFLLCDKNTITFTPHRQQELIDSGEAWSFLYQ